MEPRLHRFHEQLIMRIRDHEDIDIVEGDGFEIVDITGAETPILRDKAADAIRLVGAVTDEIQQMRSVPAPNVVPSPQSRRETSDFSQG